MNNEKRSEMWITIAVVIAATTLLALGKISAELWSGVATGNSIFYTWQRTKKKTANDKINGNGETKPIAG